MKSKIHFLSFAFLITIVGMTTAQKESFNTELKAELGVNRSELAMTLLNGENINGGVAWNANLLYTIHRSIFLEKLA